MEMLLALVVTAAVLLITYWRIRRRRGGVPVPATLLRIETEDPEPENSSGTAFYLTYGFPWQGRTLERRMGPRRGILPPAPGQRRTILYDPRRDRVRLPPAPGGCLLIEEADDLACSLTPDRQGLFRQFLQMLALDPYAGNRRCGEQVVGWLERCGYRRIQQLPAAIRATGGQLKKKEDIFEVFCSYFPQDIKLLQKVEQKNRVWFECECWLERNYDALRENATSMKSEFVFALQFILCRECDKV